MRAPHSPAYARSIAAIFLAVEKDYAGRVFVSKNRRWAAIAKRASARMFVDRSPHDDDRGDDDEVERAASAVARNTYGAGVVDFGRAFGHAELQRHGVGIGRLGLDGRMLTPSELRELVASPGLQRFPRSLARFLGDASRRNDALFVLEGHLAQTVASDFLEWAPPSEPAAETTVPAPIAELPRRLSKNFDELFRQSNEANVTWRLEHGVPTCLVIETPHANATLRHFLSDSEVELLARALASRGKRH